MKKSEVIKKFSHQQWQYLKKYLLNEGDCWLDDQEFFPIDQPTPFEYTPSAGELKGKTVLGAEIPLTWNQSALMGPSAYQEYIKLPSRS